MDFNYLLFSLDGRISRQPYWIGMLIILMASVVLKMALGPMFDVTVNEFIAQRRPEEAVRLDILVNLIVLWPSLAITIKRLHDRNRPATWGIVLYILFGIMIVMEFFGFVGTPQQPQPIFLGVALLMAVIGLWLLVELGFLKGSKGDNPYGPNPLAQNDQQEN